MRDLWNGLTLLVLDKDLRSGVAKAADFTLRPDLPTQSSPPLPNLVNQPSLKALQKIDALFRKKGLFLGVYALCEINRWMKEGGKEFEKALADLRAELHSIPAKAKPSQAMQEAAGVLVADPKVRFLFQTNALNLTDNGFKITAQQQKALRKDFATGTQADVLAKRIFDLGWSTGSCESRLLPYDGMFHFNI